MGRLPGGWNDWFAVFRRVYPAHQRVKKRKRQLLCLPWPLVLDFKGAGSLDFAGCLTGKDYEHSPSRNLAIILILCYHSASILRRKT